MIYASTTNKFLIIKVNILNDTHYKIDEVNELDLAIILAHNHYSKNNYTFVINDCGKCVYRKVK